MKYNYYFDVYFLEYMYVCILCFDIIIALFISCQYHVVVYTIYTNLRTLKLKICAFSRQFQKSVISFCKELSNVSTLKVLKVQNLKCITTFNRHLLSCFYFTLTLCFTYLHFCIAFTRTCYILMIESDQTVICFAEYY